jgi:GMP synthase (glutamine-hydrolysing)
MKKLIIIKIGNTFSNVAKNYGDAEHWIQAAMGHTSGAVLVVDPRRESDLPALEDIAGAVISGSRAMVTERSEWGEALRTWVRKLFAHDVPMLGICYGHQLIADALGGEVDYHPRGVEVGTVTVSRTEDALDDELFHDLPPHFPVQAIHWQSVRLLPRGAILLAGNSFDAHHAFRMGKRTWGVQFHPEFSSNIMYEYICHLGPELITEGKDVEVLLNRINRSDWSALILKRFGMLVRRLNENVHEAA